MSENNNKPQISEEVLNNVFEKAGIAEAYRIAQEEGLIEDAAFERANELWNAARVESAPEGLPSHTTEQATVRSVALKAKEDAQNGIPSPFMPKIQFDYQQYRDETAGKALAKAFEILSRHNIVAKMKETDEEKLAVHKGFDDCSLELFKLFNECNVGLNDYKYFFGMLSASISTLQDVVNQQIKGHRTEIVSRLLGAKNPGTDKFDASHATYGHLTDLLERTRKATGDKMEDYFNME